MNRIVTAFKVINNNSRKFCTKCESGIMSAYETEYLNLYELSIRQEYELKKMEIISKERIKFQELEFEKHKFEMEFNQKQKFHSERIIHEQQENKKTRDHMLFEYFTI